jgi:biotin transport system substrate-specific component
MMLCAVFVAFLALGAYIKIPTPFLPLTCQTLFVLLVGTWLGAAGGAACVMIYILIGLFGLPVFAEGGGFAYVLRPTFGYLLGFVAGAFLTGKTTKDLGGKSYSNILLSNLLGLLAVYLFGLSYYFLMNRFYLGVCENFLHFVLHGFLLPLPFDILLCFISAFLGKRLSFLRMSR